MRKWAYVAATAAALAALAGCGSSGAATTTVTATQLSSVVVTTTAVSTAVSTVEKTVERTVVSQQPTTVVRISTVQPSTSSTVSGPQKIGATQTGLDGIRATVTEFREMQTGEVIESSRAGAKTYGAVVQLCNPDTADDTDIGQRSWAVRDTDGGVYETVIQRGPGLIAPMYPEAEALQPGSCVKGWMLWEVPGSVTVKDVRYSPSDDSRRVVVTWLVK